MIALSISRFHVIIKQKIKGVTIIMPEILYEIPVNDIFDRPCECPVCAMKKKLDDDEVAFAMGPSYMEDDIRLTTDKIGFCAHHMQMMYDFENRLGLGLILNTHMQNIIKNVETLQQNSSVVMVLQSVVLLLTVVSLTGKLQENSLH